MRNLTLEGRKVVFKMLAISKIIFLPLLTKIPYQVAKELEKIQKSFLWRNSTAKITQETTCKNFTDCVLKKRWYIKKNVDISGKIVSLQCSWIRRLYDNYIHKWKLIKLHLITMSFGSKFRLDSNFFFKKASLKKLLPFCRNIFIN